MKYLLFTLFAITLSLCCLAQNVVNQRKIDNLKTFARLYGYVRYFYPGDEAAAIDWDNFAIYGAKKVEDCADPQQLKTVLADLFSPMVPTLQISDSGQTVQFDKARLMPPLFSGYKVVAWQHVGVGLIGDKNAPYQSARTNRAIVYKPAVPKSIYISNSVNVSAYPGMPFMIKARARMLGENGKGYLFAQVDNADKSVGFFDGMAKTPIQNNKWQPFEITGTIGDHAANMLFGATMLGYGEFCIDDFEVLVKVNGQWVTVYANNFNNKNTGEVNAGLLSNNSFKTNKDYAFSIVADKTQPGEKWASIKSRQAADATEAHTQFFKACPQVGEFIEKGIGSGLKITMPLALYGNEKSTYPVGNTSVVLQLKVELSTIANNYTSADSLYTRVAGMLITYNVMQHFFPYFDYAKTNWLQDLGIALADAYADKNADDFELSLQRFTAKLKDGHVRIGRFGGSKNSCFLPLSWEWIQNQLVITNVFADSLKKYKGAVVTAIDNQSPAEYFSNMSQYISAATPGWLNYRAQTESVLGEKDGKTMLSLVTADSVIAKITLTHSLTYPDYEKAAPVPDSIKSLGNNVMYVNLGVASMKAINHALPQLKTAKAIICDMRGYPNDNNDFLGYLLSQKDTATHWLQTPQIIYPDQQNNIGYAYEGFGIKPGQPHLKAKIIYLIDGQTISWAESYSSIIEHYKLATIVGQPTAGTNGDTNMLTLPGGFTVTFTGLKAVKLDGSPHHGVGTKPDIYVYKTITGIRQNRDEFLEKAMEIANKNE